MTDLPRAGTAPADPDAFQVEFVLSGECVVEHADRRVTLHAGEFTLCDMSRPLSRTFPTASGAQVMTLEVPKASVPYPPSEVAQRTAIKISGQRGPGALVSSLLTRLAQEPGGYELGESARISTALLDLIVAALSRPSDSIRQRARPDVLRQDIYAYIEQRLGDRNLSPATIADAHYISKRYLHKLFEDAGASVGAWIRRRRLDRCRRDLADPALADRPVGAVATRWGFVDAAHFNRVFRATYGLPPGDYRNRHLGRRAGML